MLLSNKNQSSSEIENQSPSLVAESDDFLWNLFCYRVDAAVCFAIGEKNNAHLYLQKANDIFKTSGWSVGAGAGENPIGLDQRIRLCLKCYPEYLGIYESAIESGRLYSMRINEPDRTSSSRDRVLIHSGSMALGGHESYSAIPVDYTGPCAIYDSLNEEFIACVPTRQDAFSIAAHCISPDGGWCEVEVRQAISDQITHQSVVDWLIN